MKRKSQINLEDECFLLLLQSSLKSIPFNIFLSVIISGYLVYLKAPIYEVFTWLMCIFILSLGRFIHSKLCINDKRYVTHKDKIKNHFIGLTFLTGMLWGFCYVFFYQYFAPIHQNVITLVLGGMSAGALASLSVYLPAYYAYILPIFVPLIAYNYWLGGMDRNILGTMFILFVIMLIVTARLPSKLIQETIILDKEKDAALKEIQRVSITDSLTGLYNRRYFDQRLMEEFRRAQRNNHSINLVLIDVDDFKSINDNYGHPSGDLFLKQLALAIKKSAERANDSAFRIGGDEFAAILTNTTLDDAMLLCNKLQNKFKTQADMNNATISIGVVSVLPYSANNVNDVISAADKTLYEAKKAGKNQVRSQQFM